MSQINQRLVYKNAVIQMQKAGIDPSKAVLSQSFLRLEVIAATNKTNYQFGVLVNDSPGGAIQRATELRLNLQDAFYVGSVQAFVTLGDAATSTNVVPYTYPNPNVFSTAGAAAALWNFYNGYLSLTVNNKVITPAWSILRHLEIPQTQQNNAYAAGINLDEKNGANMAGYACEPNWVLIGSKNNNLTLNLPEAVGTLQAAKTTIFTLQLNGVLAQNVTPVT